MSNTTILLIAGAAVAGIYYVSKQQKAAEATSIASAATNVPIQPPSLVDTIIDRIPSSIREIMERSKADPFAA